MADIEVTAGSVLCCSHCGEVLSASFYSEVPGHGNLCTDCHCQIFTISTGELDGGNGDLDTPGEVANPSAASPAPDFDEDDYEEDTFPGDVHAQQISSLHHVRGVIEQCGYDLAKVEDIERKVKSGRADIREAEELIDDVVVSARRAIRYLCRRGE